MKLDILAFAAHPDDVELSCGGTLISMGDNGYKTGVVDLTQGEMGTRGNPDQRKKEAAAAAKIMGLSARENLGFPDNWFDTGRECQMEVIRVIRKYQPEIVLGNALYDRHPDHGRAATLVEEAFFKAGLSKIETTDEGQVQAAWRPKKLFHYIQSISLEPDFLVDISGYHDRKMEAVLAYKSQMYDPNSDEPETYISTKSFINMLESRAQEYGHRIQTSHAEGFIFKHHLGVGDLFHLK